MSVGKKLGALALATLAAVLWLGRGLGATPMEQAASPTMPPKVFVVTPLKVDVVIARLQGEKKVASLPFAIVLTTTSNGSTAYQSVKVGVDVPVGSTTVTTGRSNPTGSQGQGSTTTSESTAKVEYRWVGTQIDCRASAGSSPSDEGRFWINVSVADSSLYSSDADPKAGLKVADPMAFRSFNMNNSMLMRDGQTLQFATATDKVTGETIRVDVTLTVVK